MSNFFGDMLKTRRLENGVTLRAFADSIGMDAANYSRIERGISQPPASVETLNSMASHLNIVPESADHAELSRLAALGRGAIPPAILSDEAVMAKLPVLFRTLEGGPVEDIFDALIEAMKKE